MTEASGDMRDRMVANLANFLELLTATRKRVLASGSKPTDVPDELKAAVLKLISE